MQQRMPFRWNSNVQPCTCSQILLSKYGCGLKIAQKQLCSLSWSLLAPPLLSYSPVSLGQTISDKSAAEGVKQGAITIISAYSGCGGERREY